MLFWATKFCNNLLCRYSNWNWFLVWNAVTGTDSIGDTFIRITDLTTTNRWLSQYSYNDLGSEAENNIKQVASFLDHWHKTPDSKSHWFPWASWHFLFVCLLLSSLLLLHIYLKSISRQPCSFITVVPNVLSLTMMRYVINSSNTAKLSNSYPK